MKVGIYSDVHANHVALKAVLESYSKHTDIAFFVCLGDVVGYGPAPQDCCESVRTHARHTVLGNHDAAVAGRMNYSYYYPAARAALDHHRTLLTAENLAWLRGLPYTVRHGNICFSHGSPINEGNFEYVFTNDHAEGLLDYWDELADITLIGHSHLTKSFRLSAPGASNRIEELSGDMLELPAPHKYIVTVGSVGQPRDNDARACFTILDIDARKLTFHRVDYDVYGAADAIWSLDYLAPDFGKRLFLGV